MKSYQTKIKGTRVFWATGSGIGFIEDYFVLIESDFDDYVGRYSLGVLPNGFACLFESEGDEQVSETLILLKDWETYLIEEEIIKVDEEWLSNLITPYNNKGLPKELKQLLQP